MKQGGPMKKTFMNISICILFFTLICPLGGENKDTTKRTTKQSNIKIAQKLIVIKPKIKAMLSNPLGAVRASTRVYFKGEGFGKKKGRILILGKFPFRVSELEQVKWESDKKVNGLVPQKFAGQTAQKIRFVIVTSLKVRSDPSWEVKFEGFDIKFPVPTP